MTTLDPSQREYIDVTWKNKWTSVLQNQNQIVNWLFAVHGGGIAGLLAFAASRGSSLCTIAGLAAFSIGLVAIMLYGTFMFYFESAQFYRFRDDVKDLYGGSFEWPEFLRRRSMEPDRYSTCECLAWGSGICGFVGIVAAVVAIL